MSGNEQMMAFHGNRCLEMERELVGTPYRRARSVGSIQTSFLDTLTSSGDAGDNVTPFQPFRKVSG